LLHHSVLPYAIGTVVAVETEVVLKHGGKSCCIQIRILALKFFDLLIGFLGVRVEVLGGDGVFRLPFQGWILGIFQSPSRHLSKCLVINRFARFHVFICTGDGVEQTLIRRRKTFPIDIGQTGTASRSRSTSRSCWNRGYAAAGATSAAGRYCG